MQIRIDDDEDDSGGDDGGVRPVACQWIKLSSGIRRTLMPNNKLQRLLFALFEMRGTLWYV